MERLLKFVADSDRYSSSISCGVLPHSSVIFVYDGFPLGIAVSYGLHHTVGRDGAGVYQWGGRMVVFQQDGHDGVERQSGSIGANHFEHLGSTVLAEYQDGGQHLGNGLDTETVLRVTPVG